MNVPDTRRRDMMLLLKPLIFIALLVCLSITIFLFIHQYWLSSHLERSEAQQRNSLAQIVSVGRNAVEPVLAGFRLGEITKPEAMRQIRALVRTMTYRDEYGENYIFMSSYDGTMLVQPFERTKEMTNQWDLRDANGVFIIRELVRAAKEKPSGSFVKYHYHLPGVHESQEKLAYVVGLPELECYMGAGIYMQHAIREQREILKKVKFGSIGLLIAILVPVSVSVILIFNRNRLLLTEVRDRKKMEELLRIEKETFFSILHSAPYGIFLIDSDGTILLVNPEARRITGYTQEEMPTGRALFDKLYPDPTYRRHVVRVWKEDVSRNALFRVFDIQSKDGTVKEAEFRTFLLPDGKAVTMFLDISDRKRAEEEKRDLESQLLQAQKMEAVGTLAGGIAHDFNNILTALIGYGNLLQLKMTRDDPLRTYVDQILISSDKAASLVQGLLAFSRKQSIELKPQKIDDIVWGVEKLLRRLLTEDIEFRTDLGAGDVTIMANVGQMDQVLLNLVTNARDAMPKGGTLTIGTREAGPDDEFFAGSGGNVTGRHVVVSVSDNGHGMMKAIHEKIFDPFFTTKEVGKGTGLGLSIVYGIVRQHNGHIKVDSYPGQGTNFRIYLPVIEQTAEESVKQAPVTMQKGTETVLIAEDNREVLDLTREMLTIAGYSVIEATDGEAAVRMFMENKDSISLIILDVVMPKKNGKEVFEEIRNVKPEIKTLFTSGYTGDIVLDKGISNEEVDFLSKPLMPDDLLRKVREMLDR